MHLRGVANPFQLEPPTPSSCHAEPTNFGAPSKLLDKSGCTPVLSCMLLARMGMEFGIMVPRGTGVPYSPFDWKWSASLVLGVEL